MANKSFIPAFNYDFLTPLYDFLLNLLGFGYKERVKIVKLLRLKKNETLLDVGCRTGSLIFAIRKLHFDNEIIGIDVDKKVLRIAQKKLQKANFGVELLNVSADKLPFGNSAFDVVVSSLVFHHLPLETKKKSISEIKRVLKRNGRFLLVDFGKADRFWMKLIYPLGKLFGIKEAETIKDNLEGKLHMLLRDKGFIVKEESPKFKGIEYLLITKL